MIDIVVRSWRGDGHWLCYLLRSIARFVPRSLYREVLISFTRSETAFFQSFLPAAFASLPLRLLPVDDPVLHLASPNNGSYYSQIVDKLYTHLRSDADVFLHMDSDMIFNRPVRLGDFMDEQQRVYVSRKAYDSLEPVYRRWQRPAQQLLHEAVPDETMTGFPLLFPRAVYPLLQQLVEAAHGRPFMAVLHNASDFNEFTPLGHVLVTRMPDAWTERPVHDRLEMVYQSWSWGGFSPEIVTFYECVLQAGRREDCTQQARLTPLNATAALLRPA